MDQKLEELPKNFYDTNGPWNSSHSHFAIQFSSKWSSRMRTLHNMRRTSQGMQRQHQSMARLRSSCILCQPNHNTTSYRIFTILSTLWYRSHPTIGSPRSYISRTWIQTQYVDIRSPCPSNQAAQKVT